jgi:predicted DNA-binding transcriptional regulator AlpA
MTTLQKTAPTESAPHKPQRHHIDRRATDLASEAKATGSEDQLFTTPELASYLGVSVQFLEIGRTKGVGPAFIRVTPRMVRYQKRDVIAWLSERAHASTADYRPAKKNKKKGAAAR